MLHVAFPVTLSSFIAQLFVWLAQSFYDLQLFWAYTCHATISINFVDWINYKHGF